MTKIKDYNIDVTINDDDKWIGTDSVDGSTKNFTAKNIKDYVGDVGIVSTVDNGDGTFTINYVDGTSFTTSDFTGPQGEQGPAGTSENGYARYDGTISFSNDTEVTISDGVSVTLMDTISNTLTYNSVNPYSSNKFNFASNNELYMLSVVFKASAANTNSTHIELNFDVSGNTDYTRLSKSIMFYKGNDEVDNFHEVFQFYTDADLVSDGMSLNINPVGGSIKYGDVIYFIQRVF